jgi:uncharacterized protein
MIKTYIKRNNYLRKIEPFINKDVIKVIVGQRRVGKSYLLYQIMDEIKKINKNPNVIYINKELYDFDNIKNYHNLISFIEKVSNKNKKNYLFIDEIQEIDSFEKALRHFNTLGNYDIYCTGSNAKILSGEIAAHLSGRYIEIDVFSLSYLEFLLFHELEKNKESFFKYIKYGGLPYLIHLELNDEVVYEYINSIHDTIILKDVVSRFNIRNISFLDKLIEYLADNIGSILSAKRISDFLKTQKFDITPNTILNYLSFLVSTFYIFKAQRMNIKGRKIFEVNEKYYFGDLGLRNVVIPFKQVDISKILENLVFNHLLLNDYKVRIGQLNGKEIDFIAEKNGKILYVQVAYLILNEKVKTREFGNLLEIQDNYPKIVVSMDDYSDGDYKGIIHMNILDFLTTSNFS